LQIRNLARAEFLEPCETLGCTPYNTKCDIVGPNWTDAYEKMFPEMRRRLISFDPDMYSGDRWKMSRKEWVKHFNASMQRKRAQEAVNKHSEDMLYQKSTIFLKSDEVLAPKELNLFTHDDEPVTGLGVKARLVKAVDPTIQAFCCIGIDRAMKTLKTIWRDPFVFKNGWEVLLSVGSGKNAADLGQWFTESLDWVSYSPKRAAFIMAGDDTFFIANVPQPDGTTKLIFGEMDFSKYDRTQGIHALMYEMKILKMMKFSEETLVGLYGSITSPAVYEEKSLNFKKKIEMPVQRATGGPDTTFGNTLNNGTTIWSHFYDCHGTVRFDQIPKTQAQFGFESKYKQSDSFVGVTFLKGSWFPVGSEYVWLPLPSQAIKIGKILSNPLEIYKTDSVPEAWRKAAYSLAKGLGDIPFDYPILGDLVQFYLSVGIENDRLEKESFLKPQVTFIPGSMDPAFMSHFLLTRYGITDDEVQLFKQQLSAVRNCYPPILLPFNPLWPKLWSDYE